MIAMRTTAAFLAIGLLAVSTARAQDDDATEEARSLYDAGAVAFGDGRFEIALERWEAAYALSPLPALLYNIGTAHDRLGHPDEALERYRAYLEQTEAATNENYVRRRIEVLEAQVAEAEANRAPPDDSLDETEEEDDVEVEDPGEDVTGPERGGRGISVPAVVLTSAGGALLIAGLATALVANGRYSDLDESCAGGICTEAQSDEISALRRMTLTTDILLAVGGAATVGGIIWLLVGGGDTDDGVQVDVGMDRILVRGQF